MNAPLHNKVRYMLELYKALLSKNEASPETVYTLSDAHMQNDSYGFSFGLKQFDLNSNSDARGILAEVLRSARAAGDNYVSDADIAQVEANALNKTPNAVMANANLAALVGRIRSAMANPTAKAKLDEITLPFLHADIERVEAQVAALAGKPSHVVIDTAFGHLFLLDYENFFGMVHNQLTGYINGFAANIYIDVPAVHGAWGIRHLFRFMLQTLQGAQGGAAKRCDVLRRLNNLVVVALQAGPMPVKPEDAPFWKELRTIINEGRAEGVVGDAKILQYRAAGSYDGLLALG